jgi:hypothetical protein
LTFLVRHRRREQEPLASRVGQSGLFIDCAVLSSPFRLLVLVSCCCQLSGTSDSRLLAALCCHQPLVRPAVSGACCHAARALELSISVAVLPTCQFLLSAACAVMRHVLWSCQSRSLSSPPASSLLLLSPASRSRPRRAVNCHDSALPARAVTGRENLAPNR